MPFDCIAVIPARGGSKRLPGKNTLQLGNLPLLGWTLRAAVAAGGLRRLIVSTDSPEIAAIATGLGGEAPWLRSAAASSDTASSVDVISEVLSNLERDGDPMPDAILLLQPTSPFRSARTIRRALELFEASGGESVVSVSPAATHPAWCFRVGPDGVLHGWDSAGVMPQRAQDLPPAYALNGSIYLASTRIVRSRGSFYSDFTRALIVDGELEAQDIDTPFDLMVAETAVARGLVRPEPTP